MTLKSERIKLGNGIYLNMIKTEKFKSNLLSYYMIRPLDREEITKNALLPLILKRGIEDYPTTLELDKRLQELYGANLSMGINKRGERHVTRLSMQWAAEEFLDEKGLDKDVIKILNDVLYNPAKEDGRFKENHLNQEKKNLEAIIESRINNKRNYAVDRCIETMCQDEKYGMYTLGYIEDLEEINGRNMWEHYENAINTSIIEIFYVGHYDDDIKEFLINLNKIERKEIVDIPEDEINPLVDEVKIVKDNMDVNQGKVVLGYRSSIKYTDDLYNGLIVANNIFGGGPNSKLFRNVREKESLAYYIGSAVYKYKSLLVVDGGIEFDDYEKTVKIVGEELESVQNGDFTEDDIFISKESIKSSMETVKDSIYLISEFYFNQLLSGDFRELKEIVKGYEDVTKEEIIEAAKTITMDTVYFMDRK